MRKEAPWGPAGAARRAQEARNLAALKQAFPQWVKRLETMYGPSPGDGDRRKKGRTPARATAKEGQ